MGHLTYLIFLGNIIISCYPDPEIQLILSFSYCLNYNCGLPHPDFHMKYEMSTPGLMVKMKSWMSSFFFVSSFLSLQLLGFVILKHRVHSTVLHFLQIVLKMMASLLLKHIYPLIYVYVHIFTDSKWKWCVYDIHKSRNWTLAWCHSQKSLDWGMRIAVYSRLVYITEENPVWAHIHTIESIFH